MTVIVTEEKLEEGAQAHIADEKVLAAGLFQPYGSGAVAVEGAVGAGSVARSLHVGNPLVDGVAAAVGGLAAQRGLAGFEHQPPFTCLAVTPTKVYAFDASQAGGMAATTKLGEPYAVLDRSQIAVHTTRYLLSFALIVEDHESGHTFQFKGNKLYKVNGKLVAHLLEDPQET